MPGKEALSELAVGMELETLPGGLVVVAPSTTMLGELKVDPRYSIKLSRQVAVYVPTKGGLRQTVAVRHEAADRVLALKVARLAARLLRVHLEHVGQEVTYPQGEEVAQIWLSRLPAANSTKIAAETKVNHVYLYQVTEPRKAIEWVRVLAHEWGHLTLPAARGFREPEGDAAGFLGERLYIKWLSEDANALPREFDDFCERPGLQLYRDRQVIPLISLYNSSGPKDKRLGQNTAEAMDYYIGMALAADAAFGSKIAGFALYHTEDVTPKALVNAIQNSVFLQTELKITLPAWVPFAPDTYTVIGASGNVSIDVRKVNPAKPLPFRILEPGFKLVKSAPTTITLRRGAPKKRACPLR